MPKTLHQPLVEQIRQAVRSAIACTRIAGLGDQESVAELRFIAVGVTQGVGAVGLSQFRHR
ncbi:hypothetical protein [Mycobacterium sp. URHB0021]